MPSRHATHQDIRPKDFSDDPRLDVIGQRRRPVGPSSTSSRPAKPSAPQPATSIACVNSIDISSFPRQQGASANQARPQSDNPMGGGHRLRSVLRLCHQISAGVLHVGTPRASPASSEIFTALRRNLFWLWWRGVQSHGESRWPAVYALRRFPPTKRRTPREASILDLGTPVHHFTHYRVGPLSSTFMAPFDPAGPR